MKRIELTRVFPVLKSLFRIVVPKLLDFSDFKLLKNAVNKLETQHSINYVSIMMPNVFGRRLEILSWLILRPEIKENLIRLGSNGDGGYFVPRNHLTSHWLCFGLGQNTSFESDLSEKGAKVSGFDHTLASKPKSLKKNVNYVPKGWGLSDSRTFTTLSSAIENHVKAFQTDPDFDAGFCLKFDIEGNEWELIQEIEKVSSLPLVIVCELHNLLSSSPERWTKIEESLEVFKAHYRVIYSKGNNYSAHYFDERTSIYDIIEVTLLRKDKVLQSSVAATEEGSNLELQEMLDSFPNDETKPIYQMHVL